MPAFARRMIVTTAALAAAVFFARDMSAPRAAASDAADGGDTYGMRVHIDARYGFSFWYPKDEGIAAVSGSHDTESFPGGVMVETLQIGEPGGVVIHVVDSPKRTITDEPNGHAAPIAQTRYFHDEKSRRWMVAYPEGEPDGKPVAPAPADVSRKTIGGLPMLPSGAPPPSSRCRRRALSWSRTAAAAPTSMSLRRRWRRCAPTSIRRRRPPRCKPRPRPTRSSNRPPHRPRAPVLQAIVRVSRHCEER